MECAHPIKAWQTSKGAKLRFTPPVEKPNLEPMQIRCGKCMGCRMTKSADWALRITNEALLYKENCFITLTYATEHLPENSSLELRDFQLFFKKLRIRYKGDMPVIGASQSNPNQIRFYMAGEYGEEGGRPHFHAAVLNWKPKDLVFYKSNPTGDKLYKSKSLEKIWGKGNVIIGDLTFESAGYVARYVTKKITGEPAKEHYERTNQETGEVYDLKPEFSTMSRRPGIGVPFYTKYQSQIHSKPLPAPAKHNDGIAIRKKDGSVISRPSPRLFDLKLKETNPELHEELTEHRISQKKLKDKLNPLESTRERREVREIVFKEKIKIFKRNKT